MDWPIIFRTHSEVEANIVRGLLETHGIQSIASAGPGPAPSVFPFSAQGLSEVRVAVPPEAADEARRVIAAHQEQVPAGVGVPRGGARAPRERRSRYPVLDPGHPAAAT